MAGPDGQRTDWTLPSDDEALITEINRRGDQATKARPDTQARINLAFILGQHWVTWDSTSQRLRRATDRPNSPMPPVRITVNTIGKLVLGNVAKLTKQNPVPGARPASSDPEDIDAAKVAERILNHEFDRITLPTFLSDLYFWVEGAGWAYAHPYWDPDKGPPVTQVSQDNADNEDVFTQLLARLTRKGQTPGENGAIKLNRGEITLELVPHFELVVDPNARTMEDARWARRTVAMTREGVWEEYGMVPSDAEPARTLADELREMSDPYGSVQKRGGQIEDQVYVHQFWHVPQTRATKQGMVATYCGTKMLEPKKEWPYEKMLELPFVQANFLPGLGTREGRTWVSDLVPLNKDYDDAASRIAVNRRHMAPKVLAARGALDQRRIGSKVEVIDYRDVGPEPKWWDTPSGWMDAHLKSMELRNNEMNDIAGSGDVTENAGVTAAAAIMALQEADDTKLAVPAKELSRFIGKLGWMWLMIARETWDEKREVMTFSEQGGEPDVEEFRGADIADQLDIRIDAASLLPRSRAGQIAMAQFLLEHQLITDPSIIIRVMSIPGLDSVDEYLSRPVMQARRENALMYEGQMIGPPAWMPPALLAQHVQEHYNEMMTEDWESRTPDIRAIFLHHVQQEEAMIAQKSGLVTPLGPGQQSAANNGGGPGTPAGVDPTTGLPSTGLEVASGASPGLPTQGGPEAAMAQAAGIGGPGQPGRVPGTPVDVQATQMGA